MYKRFLLAISAIAYMGCVSAQSKTVSPDKMKEIYNEVKTPYKYGMIVVPSDNSKKIDCPTVFKKGNMWYMTYVIFTGRGYETWMSKSKDLLHWEQTGKLLSFGKEGEWDSEQKAGYPALIDTKWGGSYALKRFNGKYWMSYFGGNVPGYEQGVLAISMANTSSNPTVAHEWKKSEKPIFTAVDKDVRWWENRKLFKSSVIEDKDKLTGHRFVMYYNANGDSAKNNIKTRWFERIGMAVSDDMINWKRFHEEPVVHHPVGITGDGVIQKIGDVYVMFYFGAFWQGTKGSFNRFAASYDLVNWTDWDGANLVESSESYDNLYAHKSWVVKHNGIVYHFYCAVNKNEQRGIAVATSRDLGKSEIKFVAAP